jgi:hypothetical protein
MININIWDDYFEDGCVPEGEVQETYAYIESPDIEKDEEKACLEYLMSYIVKNSLLENDIKMSLVFYDARVKYGSKLAEVFPVCVLTRWDLRFEGLSHEAREQLVAKLQQGNLTYKSDPLIVYSES